MLKRIIVMWGIAAVLIGSLAGAQGIRNPDTLIVLSANNLETLDPHFMIATASMEIPYNVYDSLLKYDKEKGTVVPGLAEVVPSLENGLIVLHEDGKVDIIFPIREGVKFHSGDILTPEDVEYTYERALLISSPADTVRYLSSALLGGTFRDLVDQLGYDAAFERLDKAIEVSGRNVIFHLERPFAPFVMMMADNGACLGIMCKRWAIEQGCWPGTKETGQSYMDLTVQEDPLFDKMNGTGPFRLVEWIPNDRIVLERFEDYWGGMPRIKKVVRKYVPDISTQLLELKAGDADIIRVMPAELLQLKGTPGLKFKERLPSFWLMKLNFNFDIKTTKYIGSGKLDGNGIPPDFFSDINVRKAFCYSFDPDLFINEVYLGMALKPYGVIPIGMPYANPDNPQYHYDPEKAIEYFKRAWDGQVWEKGFRFTAVYSTGSTHRQRFLEILKRNVEALNPKFRIEIEAVPWATMMGLIQEGSMPISLFGIIPSVPDPYFPIDDQMYSRGFYAQICGYSDLAEERYDPLVAQLRESFDPEVRKAAAYELQRLCYEDALALIYWQDATNWAMRDWVQDFSTGITMNLDYSTFYKALGEQ